MSMERLHLPTEPVLHLLRRSALWGALAVLVEGLRRSFEALWRRLPEPDTSIAWEDGEIEEDREARR